MMMMMMMMMMMEIHFNNNTETASKVLIAFNTIMMIIKVYTVDA